MKKVALSDTVLVEIARKLRVERVKFFVFPGFWQGKLRKIAKNACKKWTRISRYFKEVAVGRDENPEIWDFSRGSRDFHPAKIPKSRDLGSRKNTIQFSPFPGKVSFISLSIKPSQ